MALMLGLFSAPAQGQLILAQPGQVVAGKTLLSASQPSLAGDNVNLAFIGEFDEAPDDDVVDLRQGVFTLNIETKAARLLAWTGNTDVGGTPITEVSSPKTNALGEVIYRVATPNLSAVMNETGAVIAQQGSEILPGVVLGDIKSIALNERTNKVVVDDKAMYRVSPNAIISSLPLDVHGKTLNEVTHVDRTEFHGMTLTSGDTLFRWVSNSLGNTALSPGDVVDGHEIARGISLVDTDPGENAIVAALVSGKVGLFQNERLLYQEGDLVLGKTLSSIGPDVSFTNGSVLVFSAALDGKQSILLVPEPTALVLAATALGVFVIPRHRRLRR